MHVFKYVICSGAVTKNLHSKHHKHFAILCALSVIEQIVLQFNK
uniref:Uncharacterized protein n=1 Tax=Picea glauca TaxID=3330 RepID=A0A101LYT5_PICGL|nr:hypothetical protein ABT39_MTgene4838 [Picea glauca]